MVTLCRGEESEAKACEIFVSLCCQ